MSYVQRWAFEDTETSDIAIVQINPNQMDSPTRSRVMTFSSGARYGGSRVRGFEQQDVLSTWSFGGVILTQEHHDQLLEWSQKDLILRVTDHLGRTFEIVVESFDPIERLPTVHRPWRFDFTMSCLMLGEV